MGHFKSKWDIVAMAPSILITACVQERCYKWNDFYSEGCTNYLIHIVLQPALISYI